MSEWPSLKIIRDKGGDYWSYDYDEGTSPGEQSETYVPLAALSSPEVIEAVARSMWESEGIADADNAYPGELDAHRALVSEALQAAIQALQGGER